MRLQQLAAAGVSAVVMCLSGCAMLADIESGLAGRSPLEPTPKEDIAQAEAAQAAAEQQRAAKLAPPPDETAPDESALTPDEVAAAPPPAVSPPPPAAPALPTAPPAVTFSPAGAPTIIGKVESLQTPAWVERGGVRAAIKPGWAIYTGDRLMTGGGGRVEVAVVGEGVLKMAASTDLSFTENVTSSDPGVEPPLFTLNRGTFTLSAAMVRTGTAGTPVNVRDGINVSLVGGAILGRSDEEADMLMLQEGRALVSGPKLNPGALTEPNSFLRVPRIGRAQRVTEASGERVAQWLSAAQSVPGRPKLLASGNWDVSLNSGYNLKQLETMACRIQRRGYPAEVYPVREPGKQVWYRVVVRRFGGKDDAVKFLGTAKELGAREPWVLLPSS